MSVTAEIERAIREIEKINLEEKNADIAVYKTQYYHIFLSCMIADSSPTETGLRQILNRIPGSE